MRIICLFLVLLTVMACGKIDDRTNRHDSVLIRQIDADARGLDPQLVSDLSSIRIASDQFEGLTRFNSNGQPEPGLAQSWSVSEDGKIWTFKLRPDLKFSDGSQIAASVFTMAIARIRDKSAASPHAALFDVVDAITSPDRQTVAIRLKNPFPQLPALLAHPAIAALPFHLIDTQGDAWTASRPMVTSGAYRLIEWKLNQFIKMSANPHWAGGKPATPDLIWRPVDNKLSGMRSMLSGAADISLDFPDNRLGWLRSNYPELVRSNGYLATYYFAFNTRRPPFNDARVRRALAMSVDREWMTGQMIAAGNAPAWGILPPALRGDNAYAPNWASLPKAERMRAAKALLREAGYGPTNPLAFEIRFNSSSEHRRAAVAISTMWRELGVEASLLNSEASLHFDSLKRGDFALARSGWVADLPAPENFLAVHTTNAGPQNYSGYANPVYDSALAEAMAEADPALRTTKMQRAEEILIAEMPILPLYYYVAKALVQPDITGWKDNISNIHPSYSLAKRKP